MYGDTYNSTTKSCQCGSQKSCLLSSTTAPVCHDDRCKCSEEMDACIEGEKVCSDGACRTPSKLIWIRQLTQFDIWNENTPLVWCWITTIILFFTALVKIGLHTKRETREMSWTLSSRCRSQEDLAVASNAYYETECTLNSGQTYTLVCRSSAGTGWKSNFLIIENEAFCQNFTTGHEERHTIQIKGNFFFNEINACMT